MDFEEVDGKKAGLTTGLLVADDFTAELQGRLVHTQLSASAGRLVHCTLLKQNCSWKLVPWDKRIPWISCLVQLNGPPCTYLYCAPQWMHAGVSHFQDCLGPTQRLTGNPYAATGLLQSCFPDLQEVPPHTDSISQYVIRTEQWLLPLIRGVSQNFMFVIAVCCQAVGGVSACKPFPGSSEADLSHWRRRGGC